MLFRSTTIESINGPEGQINVIGDCGGGNGSASINVSSNNGPFTYIWQNGSNEEAISGLPSGTAVGVTFTDQNNCQGTASSAINFEPMSLNFSTNTACGGLDNGSSSVQIIGGNGNYQYLWSTGSSAESIDNLAIGTYQLTVTDGDGCVSNSSTQVTQGQQIIVNTSVTNQTCGINDATAGVTNISGGNSPYTYLWNDSQNQITAQALNLVSGDYTVIVTDALGCTGTKEVTILNSGGLSAVIFDNAIQDEQCSGDCKGYLRISTVSGGTPGYSFLWDDPLQQTEIRATDLCAGEYSCLITDAVGCQYTVRGTVGSPEAIKITPTISHETCENENGSISLQVDGGTSTSGIYRYLWDNGFQSPSISGLAASSYQVTVTDDMNCSKSQTIDLLNYGQYNASINVDEANICEGDSIVLTASGGNLFSWSNGATTASITIKSEIDLICFVTDSTCVDSDTVSVYVHSTPSITISGDSNNGCPGYAVALNGAGADYFAWSTGDTASSINVYPVSETTYTVEGFNYPGCGSEIKEITISPDIMQTSAIGSADNYFIPVGGTVNFDASLSNADSYEWDFNTDGITDAEGVIVSNTFNQMGIFDVVLTTQLQSSNCVGKDTLSINVGNVNIDEVAFNKLNLYPNPTSGKFIVEVENDNNTVVIIQNALGETIIRKAINGNQISIDISNHNAGVYYVQVLTENKTLSNKVTLIK